MILPAVVTGLVATGWLLLRALRHSSLTDALLAVLHAVPTISITQQMLAYAGWFDRHDGYTTALFYVP